VPIRESKLTTRTWLLDDFNEVLRSLQIYITCEGHYHMIYLYQMRFLCHITGYNKLVNLPYYFLKSLMKMSENIRATPGMPPRFLYHIGLIKNLVHYKLAQENWNWDCFLFWEGFKVDYPVFKRKENGRCKIKRNPNKTKRIILKNFPLSSHYQRNHIWQQHWE